MSETVNEAGQPASVKQKYLRNKGLIAFIALMNMFVPLSTDMYLPALPTMNSYFGSSSAVTNLTLSAFFLFYAIGILFWGPISDKYGRKKVLIFGNVIYIVSSVACALSFDVYFLIVARILQGIGSGGITSVSIAIVKDSYEGKKREGILAVSQSVAGLAPMIAPVIGGIILKVMDWRGTFWILAGISVVNIILSILFQETLKEEEKYEGTLFGSLGRLVVVARNKSFIIPAVIFSISSLPFMGYIAVSSYIYVDYFGLSAQVYSYFFAANALLSIFGPFIYVKFLSDMNKKIMSSAILGVTVISGVLVITIGTLTPILFWISFALMSLAGSAMRPFSTNVLLEQQKTDTGSVSSLINTLFTVFGSIGMAISSMAWGNIVVGLGIVMVVFSAISLAGWLVFLKSRVPCSGVKEFPLQTVCEGE